MKLLADILEGLPDGEILEVRIGLHWTAVVVNVDGHQSCGLSSTLSAEHAHGRKPDVPMAGHLETYSGRELAEMSCSESPTLASLGVAAMNALLPRYPKKWTEANAEDILAEKGAGKHVVVVGSFPFVDRLRMQVRTLWVIDQTPGLDELPARAAPEVIPQAQVVAITGMAFVNHTLDGLLKLCPEDAFVMVLGPSTPLSPVFFDHGVDMLSGAVVTAINPVLKLVSQGGDFHQVRRAGVRLVNISHEIWNEM